MNMVTTFSSLFAGAALASSSALAQSAAFQTEKVPVEAEIVADGLQNPWGLDFLPDGDVIVTERPGRIRILSGSRLSEPVAGVPKVAARGQGGLLDIVVAPNFASSNRVFFSFSQPGQGGAGTAVARA
jgi:aldose sugar dehydrogenase